MKAKITSIGSLIAALLIAVGPQTFFKPCLPTPEKIMKCVWCGKALIVVGVILAVISLLQVAKKGGKELNIVGIIGFAMPLLLTTTLIGGCAKAEMACNTTCFPIVNTLAVIGIVLQGIGLISKEK